MVNDNNKLKKVIESGKHIIIMGKPGSNAKDLAYQLHNDIWGGRVNTQC